MLKYDTVHGQYEGIIKGSKDGVLEVDGKRIAFHACRNPGPYKLCTTAQGLTSSAIAS